MATILRNKDTEHLPNGSVVNGVFYYRFVGDLADPNHSYHSNKSGSATNTSIPSPVTKGRPKTTQLADMYDTADSGFVLPARLDSPREGVPNPILSVGSPVSESQRQMEVEVPVISTFEDKSAANMLLEDLDRDQLQKVIVGIGLGRFASQFANYQGNVLSEVSSMEDLQELNIQIPAPFAKTLFNFINTANRDGVDPNYLV